MTKITVQDTDISIVKYNEEDYISLTDMARSQMQEHIIFRWLSLKSTIEYLGEWEMLYNPVFNCTEFGTIKNGIIKHFPFTKVFDCTLQTKPTENNMFLHLASGHVCKTDIIFLIVFYDWNIGVLYGDFCHAADELTFIVQK